MSQRRSYPNSGDFNLDDLFRPEPAADGQGSPAQAAAQPPYAQPQPPAPPQAPVPQQQSAPPLGQSGSPEYWGAPPQQPVAAPPADEGATQYLPPYPAGGPAVGGAQPGFPPQQPQQAQEGGYNAASAPTYGGGAGYGAPQQQPGYPGAGGYPQQAADGGRRKPNTKLLIGAGVAGVAVVAILVGVLASGGDKKEKETAKGGTTAGQSAAAPSPNSGNAAVTPEMKAQAQAMSDLLGTASASRTSVVNAVAAVGKCQNLPDSQAALTAAATQRQGLLTKLGALKVDQLADGAKLVEQLQAAWQASATADSEYAQWAADLAAGCDPAKSKDNAHLHNGDAASGTATKAKNQASELWGAIATKTGLPGKSAGEL
ncbi:hypothetical protein HUT16_20650 [Kitasatospora sp. NA04385]|uniref:hypothetical protein n=1 Tax=Kitasatospora sp. NA04385 TaxID=2742135 RepID=UPI0015909A5D|nr:hypothetical protein [Kitasatospora sp. NA04385]QKW21147.1 hypothetical protein HUT16_20650 [Kitasatospora sp. NA04385]